MAGKITVVGLGAGDMNQLTLGVYKRLTQAEVLYVRTKDHPLIEDLKKEIAEIHFLMRSMKSMINSKMFTRRS